MKQNASVLVDWHGIKVFVVH